MTKTKVRSYSHLTKQELLDKIVEIVSENTKLRNRIIVLERLSDYKPKHGNYNYGGFRFKQTPELRDIKDSLNKLRRL